MQINVIHKREQTGGEGALPFPQVYVGRPSPLGNPFVIGKDGTRDEVIAKYRDWLEVNLHHRSDEDTAAAVYKEIHRLWHMCIANEGITLVCWCKPQDCHGDVIAEWIQAQDDAMYEEFARMEAEQE